MNKLAQNFAEIEKGAGLPTLSAELPSQMIVKILPYIYGIAGILLLLNLISQGFKIMTSKGDPKVMEVAQTKLKNSMFGIIILFASFWIVQLLFKFFGINIILFS
jgi:hypothetical protein